MRSLGLAFAGSAIIYNFPWLLNWLPPETKDQVLTAADYMLKYGIGVILFMAKQSNVSGLGTTEKPFIKPDTQLGERTVN